MGNYPIYDDPIIELLELSLKSNDFFVVNDEWFIQKVGTSKGRDWAPHYIFIIWPHGKDLFSGFLNSYNIYEPPITFKSAICIDSLYIQKP